jgi:DEAD/DEAH box helicase domain-containing protein
MLHAGILPHHTKWNEFFRNLSFVVIDETHTYRGVFGSHMVNVMRRLHRVCRHYGSRPQFICCSATIANPDEVANKLVEREVTLIDRNGAPQGEKRFYFVNPPVIQKELGLRKSPLTMAQRIAGEFLGSGVSTIVFTTTRLNVEVLTKYLKDLFQKSGLEEEQRIRG